MWRYAPTDGFPEAALPVRAPTTFEKSHKLRIISHVMFKSKYILTNTENHESMPLSIKVELMQSIQGRCSNLLVLKMAQNVV